MNKFIFASILVIALFSISSVESLKCVTCSSCTMPWANATDPIEECIIPDQDSVIDFYLTKRSVI